MLINSNLSNTNNYLYDYSDHFPSSFEEEELTNRTYYDDYLFNGNETLNLTNADAFPFSSILSLTSPFSYIFFILIVYLILTIVLLSLSLYKQRQTEIENFYFGDTEEEIDQSKHCAVWKQFLIGKITKGDMEPLLNETSSSSTDGLDSTSSTTNFPLRIV